MEPIEESQVNSGLQYQGAIFLQLLFTHLHICKLELDTDLARMILKVYDCLRKKRATHDDYEDQTGSTSSG